jgi:hypothetical protein
MKYAVEIGSGVMILLFLVLLSWIYSPLLDLCRIFRFLILCTVGRTLRTGDQLVTRPLHTHRRTQTEVTHTQISMPLGRFETTTPIFERVKTGHSLDRGHRDRRSYDIHIIFHKNLFRQFKVDKRGHTDTQTIR